LSRPGSVWILYAWLHVCLSASAFY